MKKAIYWTGAALLAVAPFFINYDGGKIAAAAGLTILSFQALDLRAYNLLLLNLSGIAGYLWSLTA